MQKESDEIFRIWKAFILEVIDIGSGKHLSLKSASFQSSCLVPHLHQKNLKIQHYLYFPEVSIHKSNNLDLQKIKYFSHEFHTCLLTSFPFSSYRSWGIASPFARNHIHSAHIPDFPPSAKLTLWMHTQSGSSQPKLSLKFATFASETLDVTNGLIAFPPNSSVSPLNAAV